mmetsp:Transcript_1703/g.2682  ORF Transcript_1703/g.2682 Transcript_1703/m.2682 type:complete len:461 (+) Transcript_1703:156-1538(+)
MKIAVKPMKGDKFVIEVDGSMTTRQVKSVIKEAKGWEETNQKLICKAKILADDKPLSEYNVTENDFLVCMVTKPKAKPAEPAPAVPAPAAAAPASAATGSSAPAASTSGETTAPAENQNASAAPTAAASTPAATSGSAQPAATSEPPAAQDEIPQQQRPEFIAAVSQLQEMGFPKPECEAALSAAFGDRERAVEYLMNGIPPEAVAAAASMNAGGQAQATNPGSAAQSAPSAPAAQSGGSGPLEALRRHPQFNELKRIVQSNPSALSQVLTTLLQGNTELLAAIDDNREEFVRMMNEPIEGNSTEQPGGASPGDVAGSLAGMGGAQPEQYAAILQAMQTMPPEQRAQLAQAMGVPPEQLQAITQMIQNMPPEAFAQMMSALITNNGGGMPGMPGMPADQNVVRLTPEEAAAIDRLVELGFPKSACVEAYLACDKNEQVAANYLFTNPPDEMEEDNGTGDA